MSPNEVQAARRLVASAKTAMLSTLATRPDGTYPFGSLVAAAVDDHGAPLLLLSALAEHTKNLVATPRASLLFVEEGAEDPLASARVTLLGDVARVGEDTLGAVRTRYLARHPEAGAWSTFADFGFYRMTVGEIRYVAGFGKMGWIDPAQFTAVEAC